MAQIFQARDTRDSNSTGGESHCCNSNGSAAEALCKIGELHPLECPSCKLCSLVRTAYLPTSTARIRKSVFLA